MILVSCFFSKSACRNDKNSMVHKFDVLFQYQYIFCFSLEQYKTLSALESEKIGKAGDRLLYEFLQHVTRGNLKSTHAVSALKELFVRHFFLFFNRYSFDKIFYAVFRDFVLCRKMSQWHSWIWFLLFVCSVILQHFFTEIAWR